LVISVVAIVVLVVVSRRMMAPEPPGWLVDLPSARAEAVASNRPMLIEFVMPQCHYCDHMDKEVLTRADVIDALRAFVPVRIDMLAERELAMQHGVEAAPTFVVVSPAGAALARSEGYQPAEEFVRFLRSAADSAS
jgi:thioredoxin-related protein